MIKNVKRGDHSTKIEVLLIPFGSSDNRDLHGEFFDKNTDFGDDLGVNKIYAMYDHSQKNNPHSVPRELIGTATYLRTDDAGRWYEFEVSKAHDYHDYILQLVESGVIGASSGTFPGARVADPDVKGRIARWIPGEGSLTVTPAAYQTVGTPIVKSLVEDVYNIVNEAIGKYALPLPLLKTAGEQTEPVAVVETDEVLSVAAEIEEILGQPSVVSESSQTIAELSARVSALEAANKSAFNEGFAEVSKKLSVLDELIKSVEAISKDTKDLGKGFISVAAHLKAMNVASVVTKIADMSDIERKIAGEFATVPTAPTSRTIPDNAPGGRK